GNTKVKRRAALSVVPDADVASVRLNDGAADGYPKPHSVGFRCKERLEDSLHCFLGNTATPVSDRYMHCTVFLSRSDKQPALRGIAVNHRFAAIKHEIKNNLLKLDPVALNSSQILCQFSLHGDALIG